MWDGVCEGKTIETYFRTTITSNPKVPTSEKELLIWKTKDKKALEIITTTVNEEVSRYILLVKSCSESLKTLKYLYDLYSKMEVIHLILCNIHQK